MEEIKLSIKNKDILYGILEIPWHHKLTDLTLWIVESVMNPLPMITCGYRKGDPGNHGTDPLRAIDLRSRDYDAKGLVEKINCHWQYDSTRPDKRCAILHDVGKGMHIHLQVHDTTTIIKGGWGG